METWPEETRAPTLRKFRPRQTNLHKNLGAEGIRVVVAAHHIQLDEKVAIKPPLPLLEICIGQLIFEASEPDCQNNLEEKTWPNCTRQRTIVNTPTSWNS